MEPRADLLVRDLDAIEALCALRAWPGARERLRTVEPELRAFIEADAPQELVPHEAASNVLWRLWLRVKASVEARDGLRVPLAIDDLKAELSERIGRGEQPAAHP